jgi:hypothetical protein
VTDAAAALAGFLNGTPRTAAPTTAVTFTGTPGTDPYANAALEDECNELAQMGANSGRNHRLNRAAFNLAGLVEAGRLNRQYVEDRLIQACQTNGLWNEDGDTGVRASIESGFKGSAKKVGARAVPELPEIKPAYVLDPADLDPPKLALVPAANRAPAGLVDIEALEHNFWDRPSLQHIRDAALGRMCAPWAVLAHCAARALAFVPTTARLPPLIGGDDGGSLNWYAVAVDRSGGGKSAAAAVAKSLVPHSADTRHLGSGEGLVECYWPAFEPPKDGDEEFANTNPRAFIFQADEIDTIGALGARTGQTLLPHLRTAFTGGSIGGAYRGRTKQNIPGQEYRLTLVVSAQPRRCASILADADGGTPQRFMWFPANDPRISARNARPLEPIAALEIANDYRIGKYISIPGAAQALILEQCELRGRGVGGAMDGHSVFCREKFAYALAVLDGRNQMSDDDWALAGIAAAVSDATREWAASCVADSAAEDAEERGRLLGVSAAASDDEKAHRSAGRAKRIGQLVVAKLSDGPMTEGELRRGSTSRDRPWLPGALQALQVADVIGVDDQKRWVLK